MSRLADNWSYLVPVALFMIGLYALTVKPNLIKKLIGLNIMETSVFLLIVASGMVDGGVAPIAREGFEQAARAGRVVNPVPQALILTGIVVAVSTTAVALALCVRAYEQYGTLEVDELWRRGDPAPAASSRGAGEAGR